MTNLQFKVSNQIIHQPSSHYNTRNMYMSMPQTQNLFQNQHVQLGRPGKRGPQYQEFPFLFFFAKLLSRVSFGANVATTNDFNNLLAITNSNVT